MDIPANSVTLTLSGVEEELHFTPVLYSFVSIANLGSDNIQASRTPDISSRSDGIGIITIPPNSAVSISTLGGSVYVLGSGLITAIGSNSADNSFKIGGKGGGSGGSGTNDYNDLSNKPSIDGVVLSGEMSSKELGLSSGGELKLIDTYTEFVDGYNKYNLNPIPLEFDKEYIVQIVFQVNSYSSSSKSDPPSSIDTYVTLKYAKTGPEYPEYPDKMNKKNCTWDNMFHIAGWETSSSSQEKLVQVGWLTRDTTNNTITMYVRKSEGAYSTIFAEVKIYEIIIS